MTFKITAGDEKERKALESQEAAEAILIASGRIKKTIYLNGGSETRRAVREYYEDLYRGSNLYSVESNAWSVTIRGRGWR
jgi:hypothetical protein